MKLIIGNRAYSSWSMRGWLALKHAGFEFEELVVPLFDEAWEQRREGDEFAPSLGKVPILWDEECVVWDSLAIIEFCADRVGRDRFWPEDESARAMARSMAAEMHSGFSSLRRELPFNVREQFRLGPAFPRGRSGGRPDPQPLGPGASPLWRDRRISVRRLERGRHHVRAGRHPLRHLRRQGSAVRRDLYGRGPPPRRRGRVDRTRPGRALGDRGI